MRDIRFRAWDANKQIMVTPYCELRDGNFWGEDTTNTNISIANEHVMQYTGLKDKNGKEIYEGDIVTVTEGHPTLIDAPFAIVFYEGAFCLKSEKHNPTIYKPTSIIYYGDACSKNGLCEDGTKYIQVIGNIYENKNLLSETPIIDLLTS